MRKLSNQTEGHGIKSPQLYQLSYGPNAAPSPSDLNARQGDRSEMRSSALAEGRARRECARPDDCRANDDRACPRRGLSRPSSCPQFPIDRELGFYVQERREGEGDRWFPVMRWWGPADFAKASEWLGRLIELGAPAARIVRADGVQAVLVSRTREPREPYEAPTLTPLGALAERSCPICGATGTIAEPASPYLNAQCSNEACAWWFTSRAVGGAARADAPAGAVGLVAIRDGLPLALVAPTAEPAFGATGALRVDELRGGGGARVLGADDDLGAAVGARVGAVMRSAGILRRYYGRVAGFDRIAARLGLGVSGDFLRDVASFGVLGLLAVASAVQANRGDAAATNHPQERRNEKSAHPVIVAPSAPAVHCTACRGVIDVMAGGVLRATRDGGPMCPDCFWGVWS